MVANRPPLLADSDLTGRVYIVTAYDVRRGQVIAYSKIDVTEEFDRIARDRATRAATSEEPGTAGDGS